jgi:hypothetical protein
MIVKGFCRKAARILKLLITMDVHLKSRESLLPLRGSLEHQQGRFRRRAARMGRM